jgi:hypothetical protein
MRRKIMADGKKDKPSGDKAEIARVFQQNCQMSNQIRNAVVPGSGQVDCSKLSPPADTSLQEQKDMRDVRERALKNLKGLGNVRS